MLNSRHRTAAVYVTTSLYDFHERQAGLLEVAGHGRIQAEMQENMWDEVVPTFQFNIFNMGFDVISNLSIVQVFPLLDQHFFQLIPVHMYECFLDQVVQTYSSTWKYFHCTSQVLCALEVAGHYDTIGKQLMQYITLFFPRHIKRFRAQRYADRVGNDHLLQMK